MSKKRKLVYGVGINDADYVTNLKIEGKRVTCKFYETWKCMLRRCYSTKLHTSYPTYVGCSVAPEWHRFSIFKAWMEKQDYEGNQLDKDLLTHGNKIYGPDRCVFISSALNNFLVERTLDRGDWPIGVVWDKWSNKFRARCSNPFTSKNEHLGRFTCPNEAHQVWLKRKRELAYELAALQTDPRVAQALIDRYSVDVYVPLHDEDTTHPR